MPREYTPRIHLICQNCGNEFSRPPSLAGAYCSRACHHAGLRQPVAERFWSKVDKTGDCWLWTAGQRSSGYGQFWFNGSNDGAHRIAWVLTHGPIPDGLIVCHRCDTPLCVNPDHLFLGTVLDNIQDRVTKGRTPHGDSHPRHLNKSLSQGENNGRSKLTADDVLEIRRLVATGLVTNRELAIRFNVSDTLIGHIVKRKLWSHVE